MKTTINTVRRAAIAFFMLFTIAGSTSAFATAKAKPSYELTFIGNNESYPVFQLKLDNTEEDEFELKIVDVKQEVLHNDILRGKNISKKYRLDVDGSDLNNIRFMIVNKKTNDTKVFQLVNNSYVVDNVSVTKL
jgi:hypothetical protein